jgi:hypothetical protein
MRLPSMPASVGPLGPGLAASLPMVCAAPVPRAVERLSLPLRHAALIVRPVVSSSESPYPLRRQAAVPSGTAPVGGHLVERTDHRRRGQCEGLVVVVAREVVLTGSLCSRALVCGCRVVQKRRGQAEISARHPWGGSEVI